ncbi:MAG: trigger factor [Parcubacteria group bacterium]|jgi:trigger factor
MQIKKLPNSQIEIDISVPAKDLETYLDHAAEEISKDIKADGFRPGKAPRKIVEQKVGTEKVLAHAAEKAVKKTYADFVVKEKIETIGEPKITITKIAPGNDLEYKAVVSVMPEITLGNHRKEIKKIKKEEDKEITAEQVEGELKNLAGNRAKLITVNRPIKKGDRAEIDFEVKIGGKTIEGGTSKNHPLTVGEDYFIPGFEDNLIGMKEGDEKEFKLDFPKDYHKKDLAGKEADFKVKVNLVQEKEVPEINDEFAKSLGNFENLEKLKASVKEGMESEQKKKNKEEWRTKAIEEIVDNSQIEVPEILIKGELEKMTAEFEQNIAQMGLNFDSYLEQIKKTKKELLDNWRETAEKRVKAALALREIAKAEQIEIDSKEIEEEMNKVLAYYKSFPEMEKSVDMAKLYDYTKGMLTNEKVFQLLESIK